MKGKLFYSPSHNRTRDYRGSENVLQKMSANRECVLQRVFKIP